VSKRIPNQQQQISKQIDSKGRSLGKVLTKNSRLFSFGDEEVAVPPGDDSRLTFRWRKKSFVKERPMEHYTPDASDFINYAVEENGVFAQSFIDSVTGQVHDTNIPRYTNALYSIEVYRRSNAVPSRIRFSCAQSIRIEVDGNVILDSGDSSPNSRTVVTLTIPAQTWTKIDIYYYTGSPRTDTNRMIFKSDLFLIADRTRTTVPVEPNQISASQGSYPNNIVINWDVLDASQYSQFQLWYGSAADQVNLVLASDINADVRSYEHSGVEEGTHWWYKVRGITPDGDVSGFSDVAEGYTSIGSVTNSMDISFEPNATIGELDTAGFYKDETMYLLVTSEVELAVQPAVTISGTDATTDLMSKLPATFDAEIETNVYRYSFDLSTANLHNGRLLAEADSTSLHAENEFVFDTSPPVFGGFSIEGDGIPTPIDDEDLFTRRETVFLAMTGVNIDPNTNAWPDREGLKFTAGIYDVSFEESLTNDENYTYFPYQVGVPYVWRLDTSITGLKRIWGTMRDYAGNVYTPPVSKDIYYATGTIQAVDTASAFIVTGYDRLTLKWPGINRNDMDGYYVWRTTSGFEPGPEVAPLHDTNSYLITSYTDDWAGADSLFIGTIPGPGDLEQDVDYYYWIKGYTSVGQVSASFGPLVSGALDVTPPSDLEGATFATGVENGQLWTRMRAAADPDGQRASHFHIFRVNISNDPGNIDETDPATVIGLGSVFTEVNKISRDFGTGGNASRQFVTYDTPPLATSFYQYIGTATNAFGITCENALPLPLGTGLRLNDGPPSQPVWDTAIL
jgi:hypothetical protein